ncbi:hypothetical protein OWV82_010386 [Melia azedarach]|uniref:Uncharacterized protein n=1 Tax=Melia azedarach TaxID=155640 RepID=A0ACC1Y6K1_MELAZ|nr:hypothetical protein OWV82_010386 [Melia azedarach]
MRILSIIAGIRGEIQECSIEELSRIAIVIRAEGTDCSRRSDYPIAELPHGMNRLTKLLRLNLPRTRVRIFTADLVPKVNCLQKPLTIGCVYFGRRGLPMHDGSAAWIEMSKTLNV